MTYSIALEAFGASILTHLGLSCGWMRFATVEITSLLDFYGGPVLPFGNFSSLYFIFRITGSRHHRHNLGRISVLRRFEFLLLLSPHLPRVL